MKNRDCTRHYTALFFASFKMWSAVYVISFAALIHTGHGLTCYSCDPSISRYCDDSRIEAQQAIECGSRYRLPNLEPACVKKVYKDISKESFNVSRSCKLINTKNNQECLITPPGFDVVECYVCKEDLCNGRAGQHIIVPPAFLTTSVPSLQQEAPTPMPTWIPAPKSVPTPSAPVYVPQNVEYPPARFQMPPDYQSQMPINHVTMTCYHCNNSTNKYCNDATYKKRIPTHTCSSMDPTFPTACGKQVILNTRTNIENVRRICMTTGKECLPPKPHYETIHCSLCRENLCNVATARNFNWIFIILSLTYFFLK